MWHLSSSSIGPRFTTSLGFSGKDYGFKAILFNTIFVYLFRSMILCFRQPGAKNFNSTQFFYANVDFVMNPFCKLSMHVFETFVHLTSVTTVSARRIRLPLFGVYRRDYWKILIRFKSCWKVTSNRFLKSCFEFTWVSAWSHYYLNTYHVSCYYVMLSLDITTVRHYDGMNRS